MELGSKVTHGIYGSGKVIEIYQIGNMNMVEVKWDNGNITSVRIEELKQNRGRLKRLGK